jgi:hypothetical protein
MKYHQVLMGFNPIQWARDIPIEGWHLTCRQVAMKLNNKINDNNEKERRHFILNPVCLLELMNRIIIQ